MLFEVLLPQASHSDSAGVLTEVSNRVFCSQLQLSSNGLKTTQNLLLWSFIIPSSFSHWPFTGAGSVVIYHYFEVIYPSSSLKQSVSSTVSDCYSQHGAFKLTRLWLCSFSSSAWATWADPCVSNLLFFLRHWWALQSSSYTTPVFQWSIRSFSLISAL